MKRITTLSRSLFILGLATMLSTAARAQDKCGAYAGTISVPDGWICLQDGQALLTGTPSSDAVVPPGFTTTYLLTRTNSLTVEQMGPSPNFQVTTADVWRIHRLVFDPSTLDLSFVQFGVTSAYDIQALTTQGGGPACASLSMTLAALKTVECTKPCGAWASGMSIDSTTVCLQDGQATLIAATTGTSIIPPGFQQVFLLSRTNSLIIEQISPTPSFTVSSVDDWRIHNLIYDPSTLDLGTITLGSTTAYDLQEQLLQGGGSICASLDMSGAPVKTGECYKPCSASAGTTSADNPDQCLTEGTAELTATPDGSSIIPDGYELAYLLTEGTDNPVILATASSPTFNVEAAGAYNIHALVYDPATLDLGGLTGLSLDELNAQLMQGGGGICAALELQGAAFQVVECAPPCTADAGTMTSESDEPCLVDGSAVLAGISNGDVVIPPGMLLAYWLSAGPDQQLVIMSGVPSFIVSDTGWYQVHAFVYDPATFEEGMITPGETTVLDLNAMLVQGGGTICAGLDVLGTAFHVHLCEPPCTAGTDTTITVCLTDPEFPLFPLLGGNPCPEGVWTSPFAQVENGVFDPATSAAGVYTYTVPGPNGIMDTATVTVNVVECPGECQGAGTDASITVCYTDDPFLLFDALGGNPCPEGQWTSPNGAPVSVLFDPATDPAGVYSYTVETTTGTYMSMVTVYVVECPDLLPATPGKLTHGENATTAGTGAGTVGVWPNPATDHVQVALPEDVPNARIELVAADGRVYKAQTIQRTDRSATLNVSALPAGLWTVRIIGTGRQYMGRFMR